jgi:phytoene dehydrogenase-like protein
MEKYDVVVIGGGHNGLIAASYLAKCGLSTVVVENRLEIGGALWTEEATFPGFYHNLHSYFHETINIMPPYLDLELDQYDAAYIRPPVQYGMPLADGRALTIDDDLDKTCEKIARFNPGDADAFRVMHEGYRDFMMAAVIPALYSLPSPPSHALTVLEGSPEGQEFIRLSRSSPADVLDDYFEDDHLKALLLHQLPIPRGILHDYAGTGFAIPLIVSLLEECQLCVGGSHSLAHALWRALLQAGGRVRTMRFVEKIIVEDNRAVGVEIRGGEKIYADKAVISAVDLKQTFLDMLGEEVVEEQLIKQVENYKLDEFSIFGVHLALDEAPQFTSAAFDSDIDQAFKINLGLETPADFHALFEEVRQNELPDTIGLWYSTPTIFDSLQAPPGKHTALIWQPAPYDVEGNGPEAWDEIKEEYADRCVDKLREYAPNITEDKIIGRYIFTPLDIERQLKSMPNGGVFMGRLTNDQMEYFRPFPQLAEFKTPIDGLYLCGGYLHPGGGIIGGPGFICANVVAEDNDLELWWE